MGTQTLHRLAFAPLSLLHCILLLCVYVPPVWCAPVINWLAPLHIINALAKMNYTVSPQTRARSLSPRRARARARTHSKRYCGIIMALRLGDRDASFDFFISAFIPIPFIFVCEYLPTYSTHSFYFIFFVAKRRKCQTRRRKTRYNMTVLKHCEY